MVMNTRIYFLSMMLMALCMVSCGTHTDPETEDPKTNTDPETETPKKDVITVTPMQISAPAEGGEYTLEIESEVKWSVSGNASWVTYNPGVGKDNGKVTVTIAKSEVSEATTATLTISEYGGDAANKVEVQITRAAGTIVEPELPEGALSGGFSVSADTKVYFSKGNLQYQASTKTWRFAEHQYDIIGEDNKNISDTYDGWIDLFGWGTGSNPTLTSSNSADYGTFTDWGVNKISNGGNTANQWRTLAKDEWEYLYSGRTDAASLRSQATVNNVPGYIFLPDNWSPPSEISFIADAPDWFENIYSTADWVKLEKNGAVFLPIAGLRSGTEVEYLGTGGYYWSSTPDGTEAYMCYFFSYMFNQQGSSSRTKGRSVRLVKDL